MSGNKRTDIGTRITHGPRGILAAAAAAVVVLAIAGVIWAVGGSGGAELGAAQPTPASTGATATGIAQEKATIVAQGTVIAATAQVQPTPTFPTGIFQTHQSPVGNVVFSVNTEYEGPLGSQWVFVFAGTAWTDFPHTGNGALMVYITNKGHSTFDAPDGSSQLTITAINGTVLQLRSDKSNSLTFDLATDTFGG